MNKNMRVVILSILLLLLSSQVILGATLDNKDSKSKVVNVQVTEKGLQGVKEDTFLKACKSDFKEDLNIGLADLKSSVPTKDYIKLNRWGLFLFNYLNKEVTEYPNDTIVIELKNTKYLIEVSKLSKEWIKNTLLPSLLAVADEESLKYPADLYKVKVAAGIKLVDFKLNITPDTIEKIDSLYPLQGDTDTSEYIVCNTGLNYGLQLNSDYMHILMGYHDELQFYVPVESDIPSCVSVLAYIVMPKNVEDLTLTDKALKDMSIYEDLAINLVTKTLLNTANSTTEEQNLLFTDYRLVQDDLILVPLTDSVCIVQPTYLECFSWGSWELNTGCIVDITDFLIGNSTKVSVNGVKVDITDYITADNFLATQEGKRSPFLIYAQQDKLPYDRMIKWLYSDQYSSRMSKEQRDTLVKDIGAVLKNKGRQADFNNYLMAAGQIPTTTKILIPVGLILVILGVIFILKIRKFKKQQSTPELLFDTDEEEDDYTDDDN